ncbi:MAG: UDP-N-acetylmuramoyl-tripeptide--D-alanyl-D-alanine ligase [Desulfosoma sp.]
MWTLSAIAEAVHGELLGMPLQGPLARVVTDTRTLAPNDVFVALKGERFDGHDFVEEAVRRGASAVIVHQREWAPRVQDRAAVIVVKDTLQALGDLARSVRERFSLPVIGITGSNGKTSTKEMTASALCRRLKVLKNPGNFNNLIGVPLTLLELTADHEAAVIEMGINVIGEMERLVSIARPTVGIITNIHPAHLEGLGSIETILSEKGLLWKSLPENGTAVVNADDERLTSLARGLKTRCVLYSAMGGAADFCLDGPVSVLVGESRFRLASPSGVLPVRLQAMGIHHVTNALAAAAAAHVLGFSLEEICAGLEAYRPVKQRMTILELQDGVILVDDTYNANPGSMVEAFRAVKAAAQGKPLVLVLGEMRELGEASSRWHRWVGEQAAAADPALLVALGTQAAHIVEGARSAGLSPQRCFPVSDHEEAARVVIQNLKPAQWVLVKGSRGMTMERVVEKIIAEKGMGKAGSEC